MLLCFHCLSFLHVLIQTCKWMPENIMQLLFPIILQPTDFVLLFTCQVRAEHALRTHCKQIVIKKQYEKLRALTGMWLDWHWCDADDFLTQTCLQGWHYFQRDSSVAFLHQQRRPTLILSECLFSSAKTWDLCQFVYFVLLVLMASALTYKSATATLSKK